MILQKNNGKGQKYLVENILQSDSCTNCGACINICPNMARYKNNIVPMNICSVEEGRCYDYCPRTPMDLEKLAEEISGNQDITPELGAIKNIFITQSADMSIVSSAQHGGTVTTLMKLAMEEGFIDTAIISGKGSVFGPESVIAQESSEIIRHSKSKFGVTPTVAAFNELEMGKGKKVGVVALPCQALAFAKMRSRDLNDNSSKINNLKLVIGLFCGWAFDWSKFREVIYNKTNIDEIEIEGMDIPPSKYHCFEIYSNNEKISISLDEVKEIVRSSCLSCNDMTAEFSDISVGAARLPEGWEEAKKWNQVIVRTNVGEELIRLAKSKDVLKFREVPQANLDNLKKAALNKKQSAGKI